MVYPSEPTSASPGDVLSEGPPVVAAVAAPRYRAEMDELFAAFDVASADATGRVVAVVGPEGVGKTVFVERALSAFEERATVSVLRVRCLPATEGGTTWPLAELLEQAAEIEDTHNAEEVRGKMDRFFVEVGDDPGPAERLVGVLGLPGPELTREETEWAFRRFLSALGKRGAVVLAVDDADRANRGFWNLLANVARSTKGMTLLVLCTGRSVPAGFLPSDVVDVVRLGPASGEDLDEAIAPALGGVPPTPAISRLITEATAGDLFLAGRIAATLLEGGHLVPEGERCVWSTPDDPPALPGKEEVVDGALAWLPPGEQTVIGLASVVGLSFPVALMHDLVPTATSEEATRYLGSLVAQGWLKDDRWTPGMLSFTSSLVRDAAAAPVPDEAKAEIHESCASWWETSASGRIPRFGEIIGRHLASSWEIRVTSAAGRSRVGELGERAAGFLESAASRAAAMGDTDAALSLYERASSVLPHTDRRRAANLLRSAGILAELDDHRAQGVLHQAENSARSSGARQVEWLAKMLSARLAVLASPDLESLERARAVADRALEDLGDAAGEQELSWAWSLKALIARCRGHLDACAERSELAAGSAQRAGDRRDEVDALRLLAWAVSNGPFSVADAVARCQEIADRVADDMVAHEDVDGLLAVLMARQGRFHEARELAAHAVAILQDLARENEVAVGLHRAGVVEMLAGEVQLAERTMRQALAITSDPRVQAAVSASLAHVTFELGRPEEVNELAKTAEIHGAPDDLSTQVKWRTARAKALSSLGNHRDADTVVRRGLRLAEQTDAAFLRAETLVDLAGILSLAGRSSEAIPPAKKALRILERKGAEGQVVWVRQIIAVLEGRHGTG